MKVKIDLEKFICSLMKRFYEIHNIDPLTTRCWLDKVLEDQGLEYKDGEIVKILQESEDEKIRKALICGMNALKANRKKETFAAIPIDDCIAWLEKQSKPKWNEEDKSKVKDIIYFLDTAKIHYASTTALDDCIDWLKLLKKRTE